MTERPDPAVAFAERLLDERTRLLARRGRAAAEPSTDHVVFALGRDLYALPLAAIAAVAATGPTGPLPGTHAAVAGVTRVGGRLTAVIDAARLLAAAGAATGPAEPGGHLLVLRRAPPAALRVGAVLGVVALADGAAPAEPAEPAEATGPVLRSARLPAGDDPRPVAILAPDRLLAGVFPAARPTGA